MVDLRPSPENQTKVVRIIAKCGIFNVDQRPKLVTHNARQTGKPQDYRARPNFNRRECRTTTLQKTKILPRNCSPCSYAWSVLLQPRLDIGLSDVRVLRGLEPAQRLGIGGRWHWVVEPNQVPMNE